MFCNKCGKEVDDNAIFCGNCGNNLKENGEQFNNNSHQNIINEQYNTSKAGIGVAMCLFLGLVGLIIGICIYPSNTVARQTFMTGFWNTVLISIILVVVCFWLLFFGSTASTYGVVGV